MACLIGCRRALCRAIETQLTCSISFCAGQEQPKYAYLWSGGLNGMSRWVLPRLMLGCRDPHDMFTFDFVQDGINPNTPIYGLISGACGYGAIPQDSWPYWQVAALGFTNPVSYSGVPQKWGCGACIQVTCTGAVSVHARLWCRPRVLGSFPRFFPGFNGIYYCLKGKRGWHRGLHPFLSCSFIGASFVSPSCKEVYIQPQCWHCL